MSKINNYIGRRGYTLIEILVVLFIVAALIGLLLPAIQAAREASRKIACVNNMRQLGLALNNYESTLKVYPQGSNGGLFSANVMLLSQLDQLPLYNSFNFRTAELLTSTTVKGANQTATNARLAVFCCPSDPDSSVGPTTSLAWNGGFGLQNIDFVGGFSTASTINSRCVASSDILDGLSNTSALSEWKIGHANSSDDSTVVFRVDIQSVSNDYPIFIKYCEEANRQTTSFAAWTKNANWAVGLFGSSVSNYNSIPDTHSCLHNDSIDFGNWPAGSYHPSGVNVLFFDNHVQFFSRAVSLPVWQSISTRSGHETTEW
jgi:prepilin-type N-terminal cleavage/methylation domain-containing protein/prepilin-type processing-associated H-X9-DG protein